MFNNVFIDVLMEIKIEKKELKIEIQTLAYYLDLHPDIYAVFA
jgi:hypothetical protein